LRQSTLLEVSTREEHSEESAANGCTPEKMIAAGNMTSGYLNFLMMMGVANSTKPSHAEGLDAGFPAIPFFSWDKQP